MPSGPRRVPSFRQAERPQRSENTDNYVTYSWDVKVSRSCALLKAKYSLKSGAGTPAIGDAKKVVSHTKRLNLASVPTPPLREG